MGGSARRKAFVLLSGGMDSTTCLYKAIKDFIPNESKNPYEGPHALEDWIADGGEVDWIEAVSVDYGQRHRKEMDYAWRSCDKLGIVHTILDVGSLLRGDTVMLSADSIGKVEVPNVDYSSLVGVSPTYVPFRNGLLLAAITAHAQKWVNKQIAEYNDAWKSAWGVDASDATLAHKDTAGVYFGAHSEDAANWAYPDCTPEFIGSMANAIYIGSYQTIRLYTPLQWLMKYDIATLGSNLGVPFADTWSCYKGEELHCGVCPTCRSRKEAFIAARVEDPTEYAA